MRTPLFPKAEKNGLPLLRGTRFTNKLNYDGLAYFFGYCSFRPGDWMLLSLSLLKVSSFISL